MTRRHQLLMLAGLLSAVPVAGVIAWDMGTLRYFVGGLS